MCYMNSNMVKSIYNCIRISVMKCGIMYTSGVFLMVFCNIIVLLLCTDYCWFFRGPLLAGAAPRRCGHADSAQCPTYIRAVVCINE